LNRTQFRELALAEMDAVYRMAYHLARNPDEAADLVQETYLRALRASHTFQLRDAGIRPWLFKILHNVFYTRLDQQRRQPSSTSDLQYDAVDATAGREPPAWDLASLDWQYVDERLKHAIEQLPEHYREVLLLWAVEELKYREIADILGVPLGTVMSRLYRARAILAQQLGELAQEQGMKGTGA
jgi:RNA polymerase sigma-70 factor (ECF subfamily)